ncbi:MAG: hypothetical protein KC421_15465, partial [Anaerolineales bacterium]|nr:hypothetical protein [Anaerolineales bacterium]
MSWRVSLQRGSWWLALVSAVLIGAGIILAWQGETAVSTGSTAVSRHPFRIIEAVLPLSFALQAAFVLPPDSEPALELLNTYKRTLSLIALERLLIALLLQCGVAFITTLVGVSLFNAGTIANGIVRWLPPTLFFGGAIFLTVQLTRQGSLGALMAILLWGGLFFGGDAAMLRWPVIQPVHAFLQPDRVSQTGYTQNRATLTALG